MKQYIVCAAWGFCLTSSHLLLSLKSHIHLGCMKLSQRLYYNVYNIWPSGSPFICHFIFTDSKKQADSYIQYNLHDLLTMQAIRCRILYDGCHVYWCGVSVSAIRSSGSSWATGCSSMTCSSNLSKGSWSTSFCSRWKKKNAAALLITHQQLNTLSSCQKHSRSCHDVVNIQAHVCVTLAGDRLSSYERTQTIIFKCSWRWS